MRVRSAVLGTTLAALLIVAPATALASTTGGTSISGEVFLDLDGDGTRDADEPGRANVQVTLRTSATILDATMTDADGTWTFNNVQPGDYGLLVEPPNDHRITGGSLPDLDPETGRASVTVTDADDPDVGTIGFGSPVTSGPDVAATVTHDRAASTSDSFQWEIVAHNLGDEPADGPVDLRIVLSAEHETTAVSGEDWSCEQSAAIVLCVVDADVPAASSMPPLSLTTAPIGDVGTPVSVTGTVRLDGIVDGAPLNDEDEASTAIGGDRAADDIDGDGTADLTNAGSTTTGILVAALLALVAGAATLGTTRRRVPRP